MNNRQGPFRPAPALMGWGGAAMHYVCKNIYKIAYKGAFAYFFMQWGGFI